MPVLACRFFHANGFAVKMKKLVEESGTKILFVRFTLAVDAKDELRWVSLLGSDGRNLARTQIL